MKGLFGLNGLSGFFLAVAVLLGIVAWLGTCAISTQKEVATMYYSIEDATGIKQISKDNAKHHKSTQKESL